ncbi:tetratricopeptide repeat protein [Vibrio ponticus]|uniref:tetratricopeptide repeat protein n=1 Tax=Vibrio ponticus TaxID=265668 RepID=UPI00142F085D|nr:tetratricopeptide repeat protein [Vibrio ponticus]
MIKQRCTFLTSLTLVLSANAAAYDLSEEYFEADELAILKEAETSNDPGVLLLAADLLIEDAMYQENVERGFQYMTRLAQAGEEKAMIALADQHYGNEEYKQALAWYHKAEKSNDPYVLYSLGVMYFDGEGTKVDYQKANQYYLAAAKGGDADAMYQLAFSYNDGKGVSQDFTQAAHWFEQAANKGDVSAMYNLGIAYLNGEGVVQNCTKAMQLFSHAIKQDEHALSYAKMGDIYSYAEFKQLCGFNTTDYKKALDYYTAGAMQGNAYSQYSVGYAYRNGQGAWSDFVKALAWFEVAQEYGEPDAIKGITDVKRYMSKEDIGAAQQLKSALLDQIW